jgi:histidine ammonia-lyase
VLSHAAGTGPLLDDATVRLVLSLKVISLAAGHSGVRPELIELLLELLQQGHLSVHSFQGLGRRLGRSRAARPSLARAARPRATCAFTGVRVPGGERAEERKLKPIKLAPKEGLALLNGTQVSTALALKGLFAAEDVFAAAVAAGALSVDAAAGSDTPFDTRIHELRGQPGQRDVAQRYLPCSNKARFASRTWRTTRACRIRTACAASHR